MADDSPRIHTRAKGAWRLLCIVLGVQSVLAIALAWIAVSGYLAATDDPFADRMSVLIVALASVVWVFATLVGALRGRGWARGSNLTLQLLLIAAASGILQGMLGAGVPSASAIGWGLIVLAAAGILGSVLARPADRLAEQPEF